MSSDIAERIPDAAVFSSGAVTQATINEISCGRGAIVLDDNGEALLFFAAQVASTALVSFAIRHSCGLVHAVMKTDRLDALRIYDQPVLASESRPTGFTTSVDAVGTGTGISGHARAATLRLLGSPEARPSDFIRPGHVLPVRCGEVAGAARDRVWDMMIEIVERAGFAPVAGACRLVHDSGDALDAVSAHDFATGFGLPTVSVPYRPGTA